MWRFQAGGADGRRVAAEPAAANHAGGGSLDAHATTAAPTAAPAPATGTARRRTRRFPRTATPVNRLGYHTRGRPR